MITFNLFSLMGPIIVAGILHMLVIRFDLLPWLKIPINTQAFGANKTLRGFVVMPILGMLGLLLFKNSPSFQSLAPPSFNPYALGMMLGLAYVLFELPNSWIKRRLGIAPGEQSAKYQIAFFVGDRIDSAIGCALVYWSFGFDPNCFYLIPLGVIIHPMVTVPLYLLGIKKKIL